MKLRIARQMLRSTRAHRFLRWSRNAFLVIGVLALGYCGFVLLDAKLYQAYQARRFQQQLEQCAAGNHQHWRRSQSACRSDPGGSAGKNRNRQDRSCGDDYGRY